MPHRGHLGRGLGIHNLHQFSCVGWEVSGEDQFLVHYILWFLCSDCFIVFLFKKFISLCSGIYFWKVLEFDKMTVRSIRLTEFSGAINPLDPVASWQSHDQKSGLHEQLLCWVRPVGQAHVNMCVW